MGEMFSAFAGGAVLVFIVAIAIEVGLAALMFWLAYTLIWRAVRRGLREYHEPQIRGFNSTVQRGRGPRDW